MSDHNQTFPFEEIRKPCGNYFDSWAEAKSAGYDDDQIWSVVESDGQYTYGPPHHFVNHVRHIATTERHDGETYYHEELDDEYLDEPVECDRCGAPVDDTNAMEGDLCGDCEAEAEEDLDSCSECGEPTDDGEGYDGLCGDCADKAEAQDDLDRLDADKEAADAEEET